MRSEEEVLADIRQVEFKRTYEFEMLRYSLAPEDPDAEIDLPSIRWLGYSLVAMGLGFSALLFDTDLAAYGVVVVMVLIFLASGVAILRWARGKRTRLRTIQAEYRNSMAKLEQELAEIRRRESPPV